MQIIKQLPDLNNNKVLVIRIDKIGSILFASPFMHALKEHYKMAQIDMLLAKAQSQVMKYSKDIDNLYVYDKKSIFSFLATLIQLRKNSYDYIIVMSHNSKTASNISRFIPVNKAKIIMANIKPFFHSVYDFQIALPAESIVQTYYNKLALQLGFEIKESKPILPYSDKEREYMDNQFPKTTKKRIVFFIGNLDPKKSGHRWQARKYAKLLLKTKDFFDTNTIDAQIILMAGTRDAPLLEEFTHISEDIYTLYIGKSIHNTAALLAKSDLLVCGSTGPAHMAAATNCTVMSIVSHVDFVHWRPYGENNFAVVGKENSVLNISVKDAFNTLQNHLNTWK